MRETGGGRTPIGTAKRAPVIPPLLSGATLDAARAENAPLIFRLLLAIACFVAIAIPIHFLHGHIGPVVEVEGKGYFLSYVAPIGGKTHRANLYIGRGSDGKCHVANQPGAWDIGLCAVRLRQIEARDCNAVPEYNDEHCRAMPLRAGTKGELRPAHVIFLVAEGLPTDARELPN